MRQVRAKYGLPEVPVRWLDTARIVRRTWPEEFGQRGYGLANVANWCGIEFEHHRADEDARAAGLVLLKAMEQSGIGLEEWFKRIKQPIVPTRRLRSRKGDPEGPLAGEVVVFTGALSMRRTEAADFAAAAGCDVGANVTKKTTLLVVGQQDLRQLEGHSKGRKHRKAEELRARGQSIRIVGEDDFRALITAATSTDWDGRARGVNGEAPPAERPDDISEVWITGNGRFDVALVGEAHYQDVLAKLVGSRTREVTTREVEATLVLEDTNHYDPNAVCVQIDGMTVGYLSRAAALEFRQNLGAVESWSLPIRCLAQVRKGGKPSAVGIPQYAVFLDFSG